jgi:hypothetical protein
VGGRIAIKDIRDLPLRSILFSITSIAGSTSSHLVSRSQVAYGLQCLEPTLFNWSAGFLHNVKETNYEMQSRAAEAVWVWFILGFILLRMHSSDATSNCISSTTSGRTTYGAVD